MNKDGFSYKKGFVKGIEIYSETYPTADTTQTKPQFQERLKRIMKKYTAIMH